MAPIMSVLARLRISAASQIERNRRADKGKHRLTPPTGGEARDDVISYEHRHIEDADVVDCESTKQSAFLNLPAELRNQIYKEALVESDAIEVSKSTLPAEPGLVRANRQIRKEAQDIYYCGNLFKFHLFDYDATIFIRWFGSSEARAACNWETRYHGRKDWANLHAWLKATYDGKTNGKCVKRSLDKKADVVLGAFNIVMRMKRNDIPWETVEKYLNDVRQLMTVKDSSWGWTL